MDLEEPPPNSANQHRDRGRLVGETFRDLANLFDPCGSVEGVEPPMPFPVGDDADLLLACGQLDPLRLLSC